MNETEADAIVQLLQPLLKAYEVLAFVGRHMHPPTFEQVLSKIGTPDEELKAARDGAAVGLSTLGDLRELLNAASECALKAFETLRSGGDIRQMYGGFRYVPRGLEALYPLAGILPPVGKFFLHPSVREDDALLRALAQPTSDKVGVMQFGVEDPSGDGERGGFWLYVPENYTPDREWPLVMALHGGSGSGRQFLWSWLRDARSFGAILVAPTAVGNTWAISGEDQDTPNLKRILEFVQSEWNVHPKQMLMTGMSDGGTFTYVSGLDEVSPFTHLAPVSAAFHPMLAPMVAPERIDGLPIHIVHGALDWMFPAAMAQEAQATLSAAGAKVVYRELADLSHTYPREMNAEILRWLTSSNEADKVFT